MFYPDTNTPFFADVILPLALPKPYTYALPRAMEAHAQPGMRVFVQLGAKKLYTGIILKIHNQAPPLGCKPILDLPDGQPLVTEQQLKFWFWLSQYYMCGLGEVMNAAMPAGLKLQSESKIVIHPMAPEDGSALSDSEFLIFEALQNVESISVAEAAKILEVQNPMRVINNLAAKGFAMIHETLAPQSKAKTFRVLVLAQGFDNDALNKIFEDLAKSPKQSALLLAYFKLKANFVDGRVPEAQLLQEAQAAKTSADGLVQKNILVRHEQLIVATEETQPLALHLSDAQQIALQAIEVSFEAKKPVLLHGVTASGKTEIYISLIKKALQTHQRALYLVPEIALTTQLVNRLKLHFGESALVYHSRLSEGERLAAYQRLLEEKEPLVLLGARSALLLPLKNLGLVVVDEEHDASYKQQNPAPRYQARDAAIMLAHIFSCPILLGSATPSLESYFLAEQQKYALVPLQERFGGVLLPEIEVIDIRKENLWKTMKGHFAPGLLAEIESAITSQKKVILFQNRRGYTPVIQCLDCGETQFCKNCDICLTYHKYSNTLKCHYCGYTTPPPARCPSCASAQLKEVGFGTEKLEEELETLLPLVTVARMDLDSTRKKDAFATMIGQFAKGEIDVLIGTQMVTKGLDFADVRLVGILSADSLLNYPDFRAQERAFQLMEQVAGRAGRRNERGKVAIQSYRPNHHIIEFVRNHDYLGMVRQQLEEREVFGYPPYTRLLQISMRHKDIKVLDAAADVLAESLRQVLGSAVLGPEYPLARRLKNVYHKHILLKIDKSHSPQKLKDYLWQLHDKIFLQHPFKSVRVVFDVDPY